MLSEINIRNKKLHKNNKKKLSPSEIKSSSNKIKPHNANLLSAQTRKNDEFYTLFSDIKSELNYYTAYFAGKTIYCNCDNPVKSNFCKYFHQNFSKLKLNQLTCTYLNSDTSESTYMYTYSGGNDIKSAAERIGIKPIGKKWINLYLSQGNKGHYTANMRNLVLISDKGVAKAPFRRILIREK